MAELHIIEKIDKNSKIGNPVFSKKGIQQNCLFHMFVPSYDEAKEIAERNKVESEYIQQVNKYKGYMKQQPRIAHLLDDRLQQVQRIMKERATRPGTSGVASSGADIASNGFEEINGQSKRNEAMGKRQATFKSISRDEYWLLKEKKDKTVGVGHYKINHKSVNKDQRAHRIPQCPPTDNYLGCLINVGGRPYTGDNHVGFQIHGQNAIRGMDSDEYQARSHSICNTWVKNWNKKRPIKYGRKTPATDENKSSQ